MNLHSLDPDKENLRVLLDYCIELFPAQWVWLIVNDTVTYQTERDETQYPLRGEELENYKRDAREWNEEGRPSLR